MTYNSKDKEEHASARMGRNTRRGKEQGQKLVECCLLDLENVSTEAL
jgi:hypothetical protein